MNSFSPIGRPLTSANTQESPLLRTAKRSRKNRSRTLGGVAGSGAITAGGVGVLTLIGAVGASR